MIMIISIVISMVIIKVLRVSLADVITVADVCVVARIHPLFSVVYAAICFLPSEALYQIGESSGKDFCIWEESEE